MVNPIADSMGSYNGSIENLAHHRAVTEKEYTKKGQTIPQLDPKVLKENQKKYGDMATDLTEMNFKEWLSVTIASFRNQDPMNPQDPGKIAQELATMGMAIGFSEARKDMGAIMDLMNKSMVLQANASTGKMVEVESPDFRFTQGMPVQLTFDLPQPADSIDIEILDKTGQHVATLPYNQEIILGRNKFTWDGTLTDFDKRIIPDQKAQEGQYRFVVHAKDSEGKALRDFMTQEPVEIKRYTTGYLEASFMQNKKPMLSVDGKIIPFDNWSRTEVERIVAAQKAEDQESPKVNPVHLDAQPSAAEISMVNRLHKQVIDKYNLF